ncbi:MAG: hypothetical protein LKM37_09505 [Bacteroidales bacterium]|jgi:hypothetical protein|nr:hypothetical protein [Bacteroidales bacterium]MCI1733428.1 hypothetical protein [Bacteroidales bacterium]
MCKKIKLISHKWWFRNLVIIFLTVFVTKACDRLFPSRTIFIHEKPDTINVVYSYKSNHDNNIAILNSLKNSDLQGKLDEKVHKLNEREVNENNDRRFENFAIDGMSLQPNMPLPKSVFSRMGYTIGDASPYFSGTISSTNSKYIDFKYAFFNDKIIKRIYCLGIKISNLDKNGAYVMDTDYEVREANNWIRVLNTLESGKYEVNMGFTFIADKDEKYPTFYRLKMVIKKP